MNRRLKLLNDKDFIFYTPKETGKEIETLAIDAECEVTEEEYIEFFRQQREEQKMFRLIENPDLSLGLWGCVEAFKWSDEEKEKSGLHGKSKMQLLEDRVDSMQAEIQAIKDSLNLE